MRNMIILLRDLLYIMRFFFSSVAFSILSLALIFDNLVMTCLSVGLLEFICLNLSLLEFMLRGFVDSEHASNLGSFQLLSSNGVSASFLIPRLPTMHILVHLMVSHRSLRLCSLQFFFFVPQTQ